MVKKYIYWQELQQETGSGRKTEKQRCRHTGGGLVELLKWTEQD